MCILPNPDTQRSRKSVCIMWVSTLSFLISQYLFFLIQGTSPSSFLSWWWGSTRTRWFSADGTPRISPSFHPLQTELWPSGLTVARGHPALVYAVKAQTRNYWTVRTTGLKNVYCPERVHPEEAPFLPWPMSRRCWWWFSVFHVCSCCCVVSLPKSAEELLYILLVCTPSHGTGWVHGLLLSALLGCYPGNSFILTLTWNYNLSNCYT